MTAKLWLTVNDLIRPVPNCMPYNPPQEKLWGRIFLFPIPTPVASSFPI